MVNRYTFNLSIATRKIWGKLGKENTWLPLYVHMTDSGEVAKLLWEQWLPVHSKKIIADGIDKKANLLQENEVIAYAKKIAIFMATVHDLGKSSPLFQKKADKVGYGELLDNIMDTGLTVSPKENDMTKRFTHALISERLLELAGLDRSYAVVIGGHHGKPPSERMDVESAEYYENETGIGLKEWDNVHTELLELALRTAGLQELPKGNLCITAQVILTGFLIMTDWIASGEGFSLVSRDVYPFTVKKSSERARAAWHDLKLPKYESFADDCINEDIFQKRFDIIHPRPMQLEAVDVISKTKLPGIVIIEAPMGEGKTEAALAVAEIMGKKYGLSGIYFALPTQATSDGIFKRIETWIERLHQDGHRSIFLAHGKAGFNKDYEGIRLRSNISNYDNAAALVYDNTESVIVNDWTQGRKKGLLSDFVVGTVDQILMCGLAQKHLALRHLGIVNKVVIIDECHAYDTYMNSYLKLALNWLGAYEVPVIMLSATLPPSKRQEMIAAYEKNYGIDKHEYKGPGAMLGSDQKKDDDAYPIISYSNGNIIHNVLPAKSGRKQEVRLELLDENDLCITLESLLEDGGCVGIIRNTVQKAQETAEMLEKKFESQVVELLHSRFISCDRVYKELDVRKKLGPPNIVPENKRPKLLIVVGTQVMEQSLDVDFDVMFTDICPMDLLLQRIGRLHRHKRKKARPQNLIKATCYVMGVINNTEFDDGSENVYGKYLLLRTKAFMPAKVILPDDIPLLVRQTYEDDFEQEALDRLSRVNNASICDIYNEAKLQNDSWKEDKNQRAETFQIKAPKEQRKNLIGWLNIGIKDDKSGKKGEATVRDIDASIEVLVVLKKDDGCIYTLPWLKTYGDKLISFPDNNLAKAIAGCSVSLPRYFAKKCNINKTIAELERVVVNNNLDKCYATYWLNGELFLVLDENYRVHLLDKELQYDHQRGLMFV